MKKYVLIFFLTLVISASIYFCLNRKVKIVIDNTSMISMVSDSLYNPIDITIYLNDEVVFEDSVGVDIFNAKFNQHVIERKARLGYNIVEVYSDKANAYNEYGSYFFFNKKLCIVYSVSMRSEYYGFLIYPGSC